MVRDVSCGRPADPRLATNFSAAFGSFAARDKSESVAVIGRTSDSLWAVLRRRDRHLLEGRKFACGEFLQIAEFLARNCTGREANDRHGHVSEGMEIASRPDVLVRI